MDFSNLTLALSARHLVAANTPTLCGIFSSIRNKFSRTNLVVEKPISIIDDDEGFREALKSLVKSLNFSVHTFGSAEDFLKSPNLSNTACLIADVNMPFMTGIELHNHLTKLGYAIPTILITAYPDDRVRMNALTNGVICYLSKPFDVDVLIECLRSALERPNPGTPHS